MSLIRSKQISDFKAASPTFATTEIIATNTSVANVPTSVVVAACCKGKYKSAGGYIWKYKIDI